MDCENFVYLLKNPGHPTECTKWSGSLRIKVIYFLSKHLNSLVKLCAMSKCGRVYSGSPGTQVHI